MLFCLCADVTPCDEPQSRAGWPQRRRGCRQAPSHPLHPQRHLWWETLWVLLRKKSCDCRCRETQIQADTERGLDTRRNKYVKNKTRAVCALALQTGDLWFASLIPGSFCIGFTWRLSVSECEKEWLVVWRWAHCPGWPQPSSPVLPHLSISHDCWD